MNKIWAPNSKGAKRNYILWIFDESAFEGTESQIQTVRSLLCVRRSRAQSSKHRVESEVQIEWIYGICTLQAKKCWKHELRMGCQSKKGDVSEIAAKKRSKNWKRKCRESKRKRRKEEKLNRQWNGRGRKLGARVEKNFGIDEDKCETNIGSDKMNALRYIIKWRFDSITYNKALHRNILYINDSWKDEVREQYRHQRQHPMPITSSKS